MNEANVCLPQNVRVEAVSKPSTGAWGKAKRAPEGGGSGASLRSSPRHPALTLVLKSPLVCAIVVLALAQVFGFGCRVSSAERIPSFGKNAWSVTADQGDAGDDQGEAVQSAGSALGRWQAYPWYDANTDSVQPIDLEEPEPQTNVAFGIGERASAAFEWAAWLLLAAILGVLMYLVIRNWLVFEASQAVPSVQLDSDRLESVEALPPAARRARGDLLGEAQRCYAEGRFAEAVVYLFSYQLVQLDKHDLIRLAKGKTNRQYLGEIAAHQPLRRLVEQSMHTFEDVFFGGRSLGRSGFESCWNRLGEFQQLVAEGRG